jgi:hypothetical protein
MENQSSETGKRGIFVWRENHEMFLLREVIVHEPYQFKIGSKERGAAWTAIASDLEGGFGMKVNQRSVREKFSRMIESFKKKEAVEQRASGVDVEYSEKDQALLDILERMAECEEVNEQERQRQIQRQNQDQQTAEEMRKRAVERLGETKKRANDEDGGNGRTPEGKRRKSGDLVEILKESVRVTKGREDADREFKEREMRLREQQMNMQQQFQRSLLEQQQQFQTQQQAVTMAIVNALSELVSNIKK